MIKVGFMIFLFILANVIKNKRDDKKEWIDEVVKEIMKGAK